MDFLEELNTAQRDAVTYMDGPSLIVAGAGSGKTRVLTYKVAYLLRQGVSPASILALTFTNKAAREMRQRIGQLVSPREARYLWMGTFHSICARLLRQEAPRLGFTADFSIYDTADSKSVIRQILKELQLDEKIYKPGTVLGRISAAKNALLTPEDYGRDADLRKQDNEQRLYKMADVYAIYCARLRAANAMDFDDLLVNFYLLLEHDPEVRGRYQSAFEYVLVDEYQDTNYVQYLLIRRLAEPQNRLCVVGDDAQSIYAFRGADIRNILGFQRDYPEAHLYKLERNYRSTQNIVNAANSLIERNEHRIPKSVYSEKEEGSRLDLTAYASDRDEADAIARAIYRGRQGRSYADYAILYRTNAQSRAFENSLRQIAIPYRIYGGTSFYQRKEVKDAVAYFRVAVNSQDAEALLRVINFPGRGIGATTLAKLSATASERGVSLFEVAADPAGHGLPVSPRTVKLLQDFAGLIVSLRDKVDSLDAYAFAEEVFLKSGIRTAVATDRTPEGIDRAENLQELLSSIHEFVEHRREEGIDFTPITDFLAEVSLLTDQDEHTDDQTARVTLMTVHAAKGLEFPVVYVVGMEENLFPSQHCVRPSEVEEERRLLYVAMTRAMEECHLTYAKQRFRNGMISFTSASRFLNDIDRRYMALVEGPATPRPQWRNSSWEDDSYKERTRTYAREAEAPEETYRERPIGATEPSRPLRRVAPGSQTLTDASYAPDERVRHRVFGEGTVLRVYRENDNDKIDIRFDREGQKTLLLTYAKLEKI